MGKDLLTGKKILVVDDEPDVVQTVESLLSMCQVRGATSFEEGKALLEQDRFDLAILDIMGVDGYALLELANQRNITAVMLTAHALTPDNIVKSFKGGAASYLPKEKLTDLPVFLGEVLEDKEKGRHFWSRWLDRWGAFYDEKFGPDWQKEDKEFWEKFKYWI
ncbi:MAG: response regulator [Desulfobacteraceae bacterium]|nr:MAG: response regulator [Desulfobacteraceae bacterium]